MANSTQRKDDDFKPLEHTSFSSNFVRMKPESAKVSEIHGVRLQKEGFDITVDLGVCDDQMMVTIYALETPNPLFVILDDYEIGSKQGADVYGTDDQHWGRGERRSLLDEIERLKQLLPRLQSTEEAK